MTMVCRLKGREWLTGETSDLTLLGSGFTVSCHLCYTLFIDPTCLRVSVNSVRPFCIGKNCLLK